MKNYHPSKKDLRLNKRHPCRYKTIINFRNKLLGSAIIHNISPEGLLLTLAQHGLKPGSIIDITVDPTHSNTPITAPVFVVHSGPEKIGVWLDDEDKTLKRLIKTMIDNVLH